MLELLDRVSKYITENLESMKRMWMQADASGWVLEYRGFRAPNHCGHSRCRQCRVGPLLPGMSACRGVP